MLLCLGLVAGRWKLFYLSRDAARPQQPCCSRPPAPLPPSLPPFFPPHAARTLVGCSFWNPYAKYKGLQKPGKIGGGLFS